MQLIEGHYYSLFTDVQFYTTFQKIPVEISFSQHIFQIFFKANNKIEFRDLFCVPF